MFSFCLGACRGSYATMLEVFYLFFSFGEICMSKLFFRLASDGRYNCTIGPVRSLDFITWLLLSDG